MLIKMKLTKSQCISESSLYQDQNNLKPMFGEADLQFRANPDGETTETNGSPPLWKNPPKSPLHPLPLIGARNYRSLSPNSRAQAIARGQLELMEMVKNMPETSYELTLQDLVEIQSVETVPDVKSMKNGQILHQKEATTKVKRQQSKKNYRSPVNSKSQKNKGLLLNMVFPLTQKPKTKKKFGRNTKGKVSPRPDLKGGGEKDWWKKKITGSIDSGSRRTANGSGNSISRGSNRGRRVKTGFLTGCWSFCKSRKSKPLK